MDQARRETEALKLWMRRQLPDGACVELVREVDPSLRDCVAIGSYQEVLDLACVDALQLSCDALQMWSAARPRDLVDSGGLESRDLDPRSAARDGKSQRVVVNARHELSLACKGATSTREPSIGRRRRNPGVRLSRLAVWFVHVGRPDVATLRDEHFRTRLGDSYPAHYEQRSASSTNSTATSSPPNEAAAGT
jgi:hypothetical protein